MTSSLHHGRILQGGYQVAGCSSANVETMLHELHHYAAVYGQDGPVTMQTRVGKMRWRDYAPD